MRFPTFFILIVFLAGCQPSTEAEKTPAGPHDDLLTRLTEDLIPDTRTDRLEATWNPATQTYEGYTTNPTVFRALRDEDAPALNTIQLLPAVPAKSRALIRVSVANLRSRPGHSQELATQALMGTPVTIMKNDGDWLLVRTPDRYLAWIKPGELTPVDSVAYRTWYAGPLVQFRTSEGVICQAPESYGGVVREITRGGLVQPTGKVVQSYTEVRLPDGMIGWLPTDQLAPPPMAVTPAGFRAEDLLKMARNLSGRPYLWGGTSSKAMDCSGFTKMSYYLNGYVIPRDASQQVLAGTDVPLDDKLSQLKRGDLLFFGRIREDGSEKVTHVGFYIGNGRFLHAGADNGFATENSLFEGEPDFAPHRLKSLLRARRLRPGDPGVITLAESFQS